MAVSHRRSYRSNRSSFERMRVSRKLRLVVGIGVVTFVSCAAPPSKQVQTVPATTTTEAKAVHATMVDTRSDVQLRRTAVARANVRLFIAAKQRSDAVNRERFLEAYVRGVAASNARAAAARLSSGSVSSATLAPVSFTNTTGTVNGMPCGGVLPSCCTLRKESGGNPTAQNPVSSSSGLWQFTHDTWAGYGGYSEAKYAPVQVQNERAAQVFAGGAGWGNWRGDGCYPGG